MPLVPCARSSAYAVYYAGDAPAGTAWPGSATGEGVADATCDAALHALGRSPQDVPWWSWFTDEDGWESSPHVMCAAQPADGVPTPSPTPEPGHDGSSADGGPTYLGVVPSPSCFDAEPLVERGDMYVPVAGFCDEPHTGQVFADDRLTLADAVDDATIWSVGREMCASAWTEFVGGEYSGPPLEIWTLAPRYTEWLAGSRVVTCAVTFDDPLTTSLVGAAG
ncbi:hypothetical protein [Isoptericola sp. NPDC019482]|uniref:hypothetical protein n=1 Tax=Isoptericola sp. NPDC019482 TaxID=3154688 RepID=UPI00346F641C